MIFKKIINEINEVRRFSTSEKRMVNTSCAKQKYLDG